MKSISMDDLCLELENHKKSKEYKKNQYIFRQGQKINCFYFLKSGMVKTFSNSSDGDERTVFVLREKGIFAASSFFSDQVRRSSAIALTDCEVISIDKKIVQEFISKNPIFSLCIIQDLSRDINLMFDQITSSSFLNAREKVAFFICNSIKHNHYIIKDKLITLEVTQEDLGKLLGLSRPTINKTLSYFKDRGYIDTRYRCISILNYESLKFYCI